MSKAPRTAAALPDLHELRHVGFSVGDRGLLDLLAEEEALAFRAHQRGLADRESRRLDAVAVEIDLRWGVFLTRG